MNQTNRADAERRYAKANSGYNASIGGAIRSVHNKLPRMRYVNNLGVWRLTHSDTLTTTVVYANDMESAYNDWLEVTLNRTADEDQGDLTMCCYEDALPAPNLKTLGWSLLGLLFVFALTALYCVVRR